MYDDTKTALCCFFLTVRQKPKGSKIAANFKVIKNLFILLNSFIRFVRKVT